MQATLVQDIDQVFNLDMFRETDLVMNIGFHCSISRCGYRPSCESIDLIGKPDLVTDLDLGYHLHLVADLDLV